MAGNPFIEAFSSTYSQILSTIKRPDDLNMSILNTIGTLTTFNSDQIYVKMKTFNEVISVRASPIVALMAAVEGRASGRSNGHHSPRWG